MKLDNDASQLWGRLLLAATRQGMSAGNAVANADELIRAYLVRRAEDPGAESDRRLLQVRDVVVGLLDRFEAGQRLDREERADDAAAELAAQEARYAAHTAGRDSE